MVVSSSINDLIFSTNPVEFQAIILCGSNGHSLFEPLIAKSIPKSVLQLTPKRTFLHYQLDMLRSIGFNSVILLTTNVFKENIQNAVNNYKEIQFQPRISNTTLNVKNFNTNFEIQILSIKEWNGSAYALTQIKNFINAEAFFCLSGDCVTNIQLYNMIQFYRMNICSVVTCLVDNETNNINVSNNQKNNSNNNRSRKTTNTNEDTDADKHLIGISKSLNQISNNNNNSSQQPFSSHRLLYYKSFSDIDETVNIHKRSANFENEIEFYTNLIDPHIYLFKRGIIHLIENKKLFSIQDELLPWLIKHQFDPELKLPNSIDHYEDENTAELILSTTTSFLSGFDDEALALSRGNVQFDSDYESYRCLTLLFKNNNSSKFYCRRGTTLLSYKRLCFELSSILELQNYTPWSSIYNEYPNYQKLNPKLKDLHTVMGSNCQLSENINIKRCIIGNNVIIGSNVKLVDTIILDDSVIESNTQLNDCVIGSKSLIKSGSNLKDCYVTINHQMMDKRDAKGEIICDEPEF